MLLLSLTLGSSQGLTNKCVYTCTYTHGRRHTYNRNCMWLVKPTLLMIYYLSVYTCEKLHINTIPWCQTENTGFVWTTEFSLTYNFMSNTENRSYLAGFSPLSVPASFHPPHFTPKFPVGQDGGNTRAHSYMEVWVVPEVKGYLRCGFAKNFQVIAFHLEKGFGRLPILHLTSTTAFSYSTMFFDQ